MERTRQIREGKEIVLSVATYAELVSSVEALDRAISRISIKMERLDKSMDGFSDDLSDLRKRITLIEMEGRCIQGKTKAKKQAP